MRTSQTVQAPYEFGHYVFEVGLGGPRMTTLMSQRARTAARARERQVRLP